VGGSPTWQAAVRTHPLVTLTGVGRGWARPASQWEVARANCAMSSLTVFGFFELAAVTDPASVPDAVAAVLGITQQPGKDRQRVGGRPALEGRSRLLVFDNCEHVLDAVGDLIEGNSFRTRRPCMSLPPAVKGFGLPTNTCGPVPSLDFDRRYRIVGRRHCSSSAPAAVQAGSFRWAAAGESAAVVEICRQLDGIPLGNRVGGLTHAVDDGHRGGVNRLGDRFPSSSSVSSPRVGNAIKHCVTARGVVL